MGIHQFVSSETVLRHTVQDCEDDKEVCDQGCRDIPANRKRDRALCWAACMAKYATCLGTASETLIVAGAAAGAALLSAIDGPLPFGEMAAASLFGGILLSE